MPPTKFQRRNQLIQEMSEGRGFASLTGGQKSELNKQLSEEFANQVISPVGNRSIITAKGVERDILDPIRDDISLEGTLTKPKVLLPPTPEDQLLQKEVNAQKTEIELKAEEAEASLNAILDPLEVRLNENKRLQISNIKNQFSRLRAVQEKSNARREKLQETIGVRFGGRFTPGTTADLVEEQVNIGLQRIAELNAQENQAINNIKNAFDNKKFSLALEKHNELKKIREARDVELNNIEKAQLEGLRKIQEESSRLFKQETLTNIILRGETDPLKVFQEAIKLDPSITFDDVEEAFKLFREEKIEEEEVITDVPFTKTQNLKLEQAGLKDAPRQEQLDFLFGAQEEIGGIGPEKILSINQIEQFRRSFDWTPPFGFTENQLLTFMRDNPNATPEELEAGAREAIAKISEQDVLDNEVTQTPEQKTTFVETVGHIMNTITDEEMNNLFKKAKGAGQTKLLRDKFNDVKAYIESFKSQIEEAIAAGFSTEEIKQKILEVSTQ